MLARLLSLGSLLWFATFSLANANSDSTAATQGKADNLGETLMASPPTGWQQIYTLNTEKTRLVDYVPSDESKAEWKTKLSFESHQSLTSVDPISIVMGELDATRQNCEKIESFNLFSGEENNYPTSVRLTFCGENAHTGEGEITISKAIQGAEYLYLIKLLHRVPAFTSSDNGVTKEQIASWADYFGKVTVCDNRSTEHACSDEETEKPDTPEESDASAESLTD